MDDTCFMAMELVPGEEDRWHVHLGGWSWDSKQFVYTRDEDYSNVYELVEQR